MRGTRDFDGEATQVADASVEECFALVAAVHRYPEWCPDIVRDVEVLERSADGQPTRVRMRMHIARGMIDREFSLFLAVVAEPPETVKLTRVTDHPTNQEFTATWRLRRAASTRVALELNAKLRVPWYVHGGGIGDTIAEGFVSAACRALPVSSR